MAIIVEYDGTNYSGFQYQNNAPSIQEELEKAIAQFTNERPRVKGSGRTDAGVHALHQVVAFDTVRPYEERVFVRALNHHLPDDIAVKAAYRMDSTFDPRRNALSRSYSYNINICDSPSPLKRKTSIHMHRTLNIDRMNRAAKNLIGRHDFARFGSSPNKTATRTIREIYEATVYQKDEMVTFEVEANAFLTHQVRRMAGALVDIGLGNLELHELEKTIRMEVCNYIPPSLPPKGLCLMNVKYLNFPPRLDS